MAENKGKPSGSVAETKRDVGAKSTPRPRSTGAGHIAATRNPASVKPAGRGGRRQQAGGPHHEGGDEHEDRNP